MKHFFSVLFWLVSLTASAQSAWTFAYPISDLNGAMDVATDADNNFYVTGRFTGSMSLGGTQLTSSGLCVYIAKCKPNGQVAKVIQLAASGDALPTSIAVDKAGNSYLTGSFSGTLSYATGPKSGSVTSVSGSDIFVLKCGANGVARWIKQAGNQGGSPSGSSSGWGVSVDLAGNSYVTGSVSGENIAFESLTFPQHFGRQAFVASYSPQGALRWARVWSSQSDNGVCQGGGVAVDNAGSCYVSGNFTAGWTLDGTTVTSEGGSVFLAKFNARQGRLVWAKGQLPYGDGRSIATDRKGNIYIASNFSGTTTIGTTTLTSAGNTDGFVARFNPQGNVKWATALGGPESDYISDIAVDQQSGKVFATGMMNFTYNSTNQSFLAQLNPDGQKEFAELVSGPGTSSAGKLAIDSKHNLYTTGAFTGSCGFGPVSLKSVHTQGYIGRYSIKSVSQVSTPPSVTVSIFPNPVQSRFTLQLASSEKVEALQATLYSYQGRAVASHALQPLSNLAEINFDTTKIPDGLYVLQLEYKQGISFRMVTVHH
ncbi:SBBP repeat-containing protein [Hymenobacter jejuensis]|uniref:T9SS type A sorting domain-containing protein n=1 Tax=Hymenobacter jejuensis TaxID=2502781 RepID=A0A5B8A2S1_9BACT|nr:SBBP repeat-containing protein [Hymenobacter jejuensis]QDA61006.1 T9SS type A sorting domain-containing protein [Hymenobacter jejuensis]